MIEFLAASHSTVCFAKWPKGHFGSWSLLRVLPNPLSTPVEIEVTGLLNIFIRMHFHTLFDYLLRRPPFPPSRKAKSQDKGGRS